MKKDEVIDIIIGLIDKRIKSLSKILDKERKYLQKEGGSLLISHDVKTKLYELNLIKMQIISQFSESVKERNINEKK